MQRTGQFVIYRAESDDFLGEHAEGDGAGTAAWREHPGEAVRFAAFETAERLAMALAEADGCVLVVCELEESATEMGLVPVVEIHPADDEDAGEPL